MNLLAELEQRGLIHNSTDREALEAAVSSGPISLYYGCDPTADSLHVGNLIGLVVLRRFQALGHKPIALAGGGTGMVGDPSGKSTDRPILAPEVLAQNLAAISAQIRQIVPEATIVDNEKWLGSLRLVDFLRDVGKHATVSSMIAKESVRSRIGSESGISFTEFAYMLLQAYDFYRLHLDYGCALQQGGSDQWGNITTGVELVRKLTGDQVFGFTTPLLTSSDGAKLGKSSLTDEWVWLDRSMTSPYELYQYLVNLDDDVVGMMLRALTFLSHDEILELESQTATAPEQRAGQRRLAREVVAFVHSERDAVEAIATSEALFNESLASLDLATLMAVTANAPSSTVSRDTFVTGVPVVELLVTTKLASSLGDARRGIEQGGIYVNNRRTESVDASVTLPELLHDRYVLLRRGKRSLHLVVAE